MKGIVHIEFNGNKERLHFNRYAFDELKKFFFQDKMPAVITEADLMKVIIERWRENESLLLKQLVYAGILGDSLIKDDVPRISKQEVGEVIATASDEELLEVWKVFLDSSGINLTPDPDVETQEEEQTEDEKKKEMKTS